MRDREVWRNELISEVRTIADEEELRRLWSGVDPRAVSSFAEEVAHVFDDYDIDEFIAVGAEKMKLSRDQFDALRTFRDKFAAYLDKVDRAKLSRVSSDVVLDDPRWRDVMRAARAFVNLLD